MGDGIGAISEVDMQENLHDLVFLRLCHMIGDWRQFSMIKLAIFDSKFDEYFSQNRILFVIRIIRFLDLNCGRACCGKS